MERKKPEEVLAEVRNHHYASGITRIEAGRMLGCSGQTVVNILASGKYMNLKQAEKFAGAFGYHRAFLMSGEGCLMEKDCKDIRICSDGFERGNAEISEYFRQETANLVACKLLALLDGDAYEAYLAFLTFQDEKYLSCLKRFMAKHPEAKGFPGDM